MEKKKRNILIISLASVLVLAAVAIIIPVVACQPKNNETEYQFDTSRWEFNENEHWNKCTDESVKDSENLKNNNKAKHVDEDHDDICDVCHLPLKGTEGLYYKDVEGGVIVSNPAYSVPNINIVMATPEQYQDMDPLTDYTMPLFKIKHDGDIQSLPLAFVHYMDDTETDDEYYDIKDTIEALKAKLSVFSTVTSGKIIVPGYTADHKKVIGIEAGAFAGMKNIKEVVLPETIETIGDGAFENVIEISKINIPDSVTSLGKALFSCVGFEKPVGEYEGNLKVSFGKNITKIPDYTFVMRAPMFQVAAINSFDFSGITEVGKAAFYGTGLTDIELKNETTTLKPFSFSGVMNARSLNLPSTLTTIPENCFLESFLPEDENEDPIPVSLELPSTLKNIGTKAFHSCGITSLTLHGGKDQNDKLMIKSGAFHSCDKLTSLKTDGVIEFEAGDDYDGFHPDDVRRYGVFESAFDGYSSNSDVNIILGEGIKQIPANTFRSMGCLSNSQYKTNLVLPKGLTSIGDNAFDSSTGSLGIQHILLPEGLDISSVAISTKGNGGTIGVGDTPWGFVKKDNTNYDCVYSYAESHTAGKKEWHYKADGSIEVYGN